MNPEKICFVAHIFFTLHVDELSATKIADACDAMRLLLLAAGEGGPSSFVSDAKSHGVQTKDLWRVCITNAGWGFWLFNRRPHESPEVSHL